MAVLSRTSDKFSVGILYCIVRRPARELWPVGEESAGTGLAEVKFRLSLTKCQTLNREFFYVLGSNFNVVFDRQKYRRLFVLNIGFLRMHCRGIIGVYGEIEVEHL